MTKQEQFEQLYVSSKSKLLAIAFNMVKNKEAAEDVLQDSYIKAWKKFDEYDSSKKFVNWMTTIVRNTAIDSSRAKNRKLNAFSIDTTAVVNNKSVSFAIPDASQDLFKNYEQNDLAINIENAINSLPKDLKAVMIPLSSGHSYVEIATMTNISVSAVRARVHRAKQILRKDKNLANFARFLVQ